MSKEKPKLLEIVVAISIIFITLMSIGVFVVMSGFVSPTSQEFAENAEILDQFGDLVETDIQTILQEDSAKYETALSNLYDLYSLNDQYHAMIDYNTTHPANYTQKDFDEVKMEFNIKMRLLINNVQSTILYHYCITDIASTAANNYSYLGWEYFFIINQWNNWGDPYELMHNDIRDYMNASFALSGDPLEIPEIKFDRWTYHLYNNISMLIFIDFCKSPEYIESFQYKTGLSLVNLSLAKVSSMRDEYISLYEKIAQLNGDFNNTLITLALGGVLMGFAITFENKGLRIISLVVGLMLILLSITYFTSAISELIHSISYESAIITLNDFVNI